MKAPHWQVIARRPACQLELDVDLERPASGTAKRSAGDGDAAGTCASSPRRREWRGSTCWSLSSGRGRKPGSGAGICEVASAKVRRGAGADDDRVATTGAKFGDNARPAFRRACPRRRRRGGGCGSDHQPPGIADERRGGHCRREGALYSDIGWRSRRSGSRGRRSGGWGALGADQSPNRRSRVPELLRRLLGWVRRELSTRHASRPMSRLSPGRAKVEKAARHSCGHSPAWTR
jgi:hypothetical protein